MSKLDGKIAVITGATSGMGLATARLLATEGAHVYITGRRKDKLDQAAEAIDAAGPGAVTGVQADSSIPADLDRLFETVKNGHGRVDVVYANAGGASLTEPLEAITAASFDDIFRVNVRGTRVNLLGIGPVDTAAWDGTPAEIRAAVTAMIPGRPVWAPRGDRPRRAVPRRRRLQLRLRHRASRRRRRRPGLTIHRRP